MDKVTVRRRSPDPKRPAQEGDPWQGDFSFVLEGIRKRVRRNLDLPPSATPKQALAAAKAMQAQVRREAEPINAVHALRASAASAGIELPRVSTAPVAFSGLADLYLQSVKLTRKPSTYATQERQIAHSFIPWWGDRDMRHATSDDVRAWQVWLMDHGKAARTALVLTRILGAIWSLGVRKGHLQGPSPTKGLYDLRLSSNPRPWYDGAQMAVLLEHLSRTAPPSIYRLFVVLFRTGLRRGEALSLRACDVDLSSRESARVTVERTYHRLTNSFGTPKSGKRRTVALHPDAYEALLAQRQERGLHAMSQDLLWVGRSGLLPLGDAMPAYHLNLATKACGLPHLNVHGTRHSFASQLACQGVSLRIVAEMLGQSTLSVTEMYAHISEGSARSALAHLPPLRPPLLAHLSHSNAPSNTPPEGVDGTQLEQARAQDATS